MCMKLTPSSIPYATYARLAAESLVVPRMSPLDEFRLSMRVSRVTSFDEKFGRDAQAGRLDHSSVDSSPASSTASESTASITFAFGT